MNILAIHAHPDDIEILGAGTMALLVEAGHDVTCSTMTPGDCGSLEYGPEQIALIRRREAAAGAATIGARYICAEFRDLNIFNEDSARRRVCELIRQVQPEIVITSSPIDYHCDHEATSMLVRDACFAATAPNYKTGGSAPAIPAVPHLYFMDSIEGADRDGKPQLADFHVNIASTFERKREALACHASQRDWLKKIHGMDDYILQMEAWTRAVGKRCNVEFAEGFRRYRAHPFPQSPRLEELLKPWLA